MVATSLFASAQDEIPVLNKHRILIKASIYSFFDQSPVIQKVYGSDKTIYSNSLGLAYGYWFNKKNGVSLTVDRFHFENTTSLTELERGEVSSRRFLKITGQYHRTFLDVSKHSISGNLGISYRKGSERIFGNYVLIDSVFGESNQILKRTRDFGGTIGVEYNYQLFKNIYLSTDLRYSYFVYVKEKPTLTWDPGVTRNELSFSIGLGFNFGN